MSATVFPSALSVGGVPPERERRPDARAFDDFMGMCLTIRRYALAVLIAVSLNLTVSIYTLTQAARTDTRVKVLEQRVERLERAH